MKIRVFKAENGHVYFNIPTSPYQDGEQVDDLGRPIYEESEDFSKPIKNKEGITIGFNKIKRLIGYEKKTLTIDDCPIPSSLKGLDFVILEDSEIPVIDRSKGERQEMMYFDGDCKKENLKIDRAWQTRIMPPHVIREKEVKNIDSKINAELSKENPDFILVQSLKIKQEKVRATRCDCRPCFCECEEGVNAFKMAVNNIQSQKIDKPEVLKALNQRIKLFKK